jgi:hypothetical protein
MDGWMDKWMNGWNGMEEKRRKLKVNRNTGFLVND